MEIEKELGRIATTEMIERLLREKVGVEVKVTECRSGNCIVATLERKGMEMDVMRSKNKLRGERNFIEKDLTWEERKTQERIYRWVKQEREKGIYVKVGFARVQEKGVWRKWEEIEKEMREREERAEKRRETEKNIEDREEQNEEKEREERRELGEGKGKGKETRQGL